jgi:hypothetical protein
LIGRKSVPFDFNGLAKGYGFRQKTDRTLPDGVIIPSQVNTRLKHTAMRGSDSRQPHEGT